jgi:hypothetical protein
MINPHDLEHSMKSTTPPPPANRLNEESLQQTYEEMLKEFKRMRLDAGEKKKLIAMLLKYRSAWNSYLSIVKSKHRG